MFKKAILRYIFVIISTAALCAAEFSSLRPCGGGFATALVYCGLPAIAALPSFLIFSLVFDFSLASLLYALSVCVLSFGAALASLRFAKYKKAFFGAAAVLSQFSLFAYLPELGAIGISVWGMLAVGVYAASVCFLSPFTVRKLGYKLLETELVSGGVLLICASLGLGFMRIKGFDLSYPIAAFALPLSVAIGSLSGSVGLAMCFGCGMAIYAASPIPIAVMAFVALVTAVFSAAPKPIPSLACVFGYILISYLFAFAPTWQQAVGFGVGALMCAFVPSSVTDKLRKSLFSPVTDAAVRGMIGRVTNETANNLIGASRIFDDMKTAMESVPESAGECILENAVCRNCRRYGECSASAGYREALAKMERDSAVKGRASVAEIPALLAVCDNLSALVSYATESASERHERIMASEAKREGRKVVAHQLGLMSGVLRSLGERVRTPAEFDTRCEKKIATELSYRGAAVPEVLVTEDMISVVIRSENLTGADVAKAVSRVMKAPYEYVRGGVDVLPGYTHMMFTRAPRYEVAFSVAAQAKEERSGDNHSFVHLGGDRFMMALCDGMGSGEEAEKASETAIELVESFFKAGLDSCSAVECVNRFLALNECERFSTLDITVIDLNSGNAEIIKMSSPATVIKSADGVSAVSGSSLPMGVFENVTVSHASRSLSAGDEIIMATDGVTDALGSAERFAQAAAAQNTVDPHIEAQNILECAVSSAKGRLSDDATVLCARIFEKSA